MKKIIMTVLLGACAGGAAAQSNVVIYGLMDVGFAQRDGGRYEGGITTPTLVNNANNSSRWGIKGSEDLGGGMKANFALEETFKPLTGVGGASGIVGFDRQAWVGLSGNFGQVRMGRQASVIDQVLLQYDLNYGANATSAYGNVGLQAIYDAAYGTRRSAQLQYWTQPIYGLSIQTGFIDKNDVLGPNSVVLKQPDNVYQIGANYVAGQFSAGAAYESKHGNVPGLGANWGAGAKYNFGSFVTSINYYDNALNTDGKGYGAGVLVPIGASANVGAQVAHNTLAKATAWELFSNYYLTKRTSFYALYGGMDNNAAIYDKAAKKNSFALGMVTSF